MTSQGTVVIWSIPDSRAESTFQAYSSVVPVMDASRKLLAFSSFNGVYLINIVTGKLIGPLNGPPLTPGTLSFSPDGRHLAMLAGGRQLAIWNLVKGQYLGRFVQTLPPVQKFPPRTPDLWQGISLQWLNNRFIELNGHIFDLLHRRIIARLSTPFAYYSFAGFTRSFDHRCWTLQRNGNRWQLVGVRLPTQAMLLHATKRAGMAGLVVKPGDAITVKIIPGNFLGLSHKFLHLAQRQLRHRGFFVRSDQKLVLTVSAHQGKSISRRFGYGLFGQLHPFTLSATSRIVRWRLRKDGVVIWQRRLQCGPIIPMGLPYQANKNPQEYIDNYNNNLFAHNVRGPEMPSHIFSGNIADTDVSVIGPHGLLSNNQSRFFTLPGLRR